MATGLFLIVGGQFQKYCQDRLNIYHYRAGMGCLSKAELSPLQWDLFGLGELETFNRQMMRVYKKDLEDLVMGYEAYIQAIYRQLDRRKPPPDPS